MTARIESALSFIPSDDRETWIAMGMAVKSELGEAGFDVWDEWSRAADNYNPRSSRASWRGFRPVGGITAGTLFHEARARGWRDTSDSERPSAELLQARRRAAEARATAEGQAREKERQQAASKAAWILGQCKPEKHAYLQSKGWPDALGQVWRVDEENNLLCIPMRVGQNLVGIQMIDRNGSKKYLQGQRTSGAEYVISNPGSGALDFWVEGYASGLSLRACLSALRMRYRIHITFSAGNLKAMANSGYVIADNDASGTGEKAAIATGLPYWMSDVTGEDINDAHKRLGLFGCSQMLRKWLY